MHIFGPVQSRRFGTSLGVDLSSSIKQCNFDCLYCELAPALTTKKQKYITPPDEIITELKSALIKHPNIDVITITANGEPTLYPHLPELIDMIDSLKDDKKTLILSNGTNLENSAIFDALLKFDRVKLSLDAATPEVFKKIDRPHENISIDSIIENIIRFSHTFKGELSIEILFVSGVNDSDSEIEALERALKQIKCDRVDIGTIDRPPAYSVKALSYDELYAISQKFSPSIPIHIATRVAATSKASSYSSVEIISMLDKRPLTDGDIEILFDTDSKQTLSELLKSNKISKKTQGGVDFYLPTTNLNRKRNQY